MHILKVSPCNDNVIGMTIEDYILDFQGTKMLLRWKAMGCESFDNNYKAIKNVTITVAHILLYPNGQCTWNQLLNNEQYSQLLQCASMHDFVFLCGFFFFLVLFFAKFTVTT